MPKVNFTSNLKRFYPDLETVEVSGETIAKVLSQIETAARRATLASAFTYGNKIYLMIKLLRYSILRERVLKKNQTK